MINDGRDRCNVPVDAVELGAKFWKGFNHRHPNFVSRKYQQVEKARSDAERSELLEGYANDFEDFLEKYRDANGELLLQPDQFHNLDESGIEISFKNSRFFARRGSQRTRMNVPDLISHVTILVTISGNGTHRCPLFIYKASSSISVEHMTGGPDDALYNRSETGYINTSIFDSYMKALQTDLEAERAKRRLKPDVYSLPDVDIVMTDGHSSRFYLPMLRRSGDAGIFLFKFPSHLTHLLQPLDVLFFGKFKAILRTLINKWYRGNVGTPFSVTVVPKLCREAFDLITPIKQSFLRAGIVPFDVDRIRSAAKPPDTLAIPMPVTEIQSIVQNLFNQHFPAPIPAERDPRRVSFAHTSRGGCINDFILFLFAFVEKTKGTVKRALGSLCCPDLIFAVRVESCDEAFIEYIAKESIILPPI
jgi:hypothetical protein